MLIGYYIPYITQVFPPTIKDYHLQYTAQDDNFQDLVIKFRKEIVDLEKHDNPYLPKILLGDLGTGKTHFLQYLYLKLGESDLDLENTLCSWVDLTGLKKDSRFQYLFLKGLKTFNDDIFIDDSRHYQKILQAVYRRLADSSIPKDKKVTDAQRQIIVRKVLEKFWDVTTGLNPIAYPTRWFAGYILRRLQQEQEKRYEEETKNRAISERVSGASDLVYEKDFINEFIKLGEGKSISPDFDGFVQKLAKQSEDSQLMDLIMRLLKMAGYKLVVIFIDEMEQNIRTDARDEEREAKTSYYSQQTTEILKLFFQLHNKMSDHGSKVYPSIAQIMVMPDYLHADVVKKNNLALYQRWQWIAFPLNIITQEKNTANRLIENMWKLHQEAGYSLKTNSSDNSDQIYKNIKETLYNRLNKKDPSSQKATPATMRNVIHNIIDIIRTEWMEIR